MVKDPIGDKIEQRMREYLHRGKKLSIEVFGADTKHDHNLIAVQLAGAMIRMEAAERLADAPPASMPPTPASTGGRLTLKQKGD